MTWTCAMAAAANVFLTVQSVKGDDAVGDVEFANQPLRGGDLVGLFLGIECVQQLGRLAVAEIVETAPQRLAVERDGAPGRIGRVASQTGGVPAENLLDSLRIEA